VYGRCGVDHGLHFPASDHIALVVLLVLEHQALAAALRHARHPRTRPAHQRHVRVRGLRFVIDGGRRVDPAAVGRRRRRRGGGGRAGRGRSGRRPGGCGGRRGFGVDSDTVHQRHAVDAILGAGESKPPVNAAGRPVFLSEHDQPPVVQHRHVLVDDGHLPGAHVTRHAAVHVEQPTVGFEVFRQVRSLQELHVGWYPPEIGREFSVTSRLYDV